MDKNNTNVITPDSLIQETPVKIPTQGKSTTNLQGITGGVADSILADFERLNKTTKEGQKSQTETGTDILSLMGDLTGKTGALAEAQKATGVGVAQEQQDKFAQQLADLNAQASALNREAQAIPLQIQERFKGTGATDAGVAPIQAGELRKNALKALSIGQQSDIASAALTGSMIKLQAAKDKAQQMVDLKYEPLEQELAIKQKQYDLNKDILKAYDAKRTEALGIALAKEEKALADKKEQDKISQGFILNAIQGKAPQNIVDQAREIVAKGGTSTDVAETLGEYSLSGAERLDLAFKNMEMKRLSNEIALGSIEGFDGLPMTEEEADVMVSGIESVKALMNNKKLAKSSGGLLDRGWFVGADRAEWLADVTSMINSLTLDTFIEAKAKGATFGAMSEGEWEILKASATPLAEKMVKFKFGAKKGKVKRFTGTDEGLKADIRKIYEAQKQNYEARTGTPYPEVTENSITVDGDGNLIIDGTEESNEMFWGNLETIRNQ